MAEIEVKNKGEFKDVIISNLKEGTVITIDLRKAGEKENGKGK